MLCHYAVRLGGYSVLFSSLYVSILELIKILQHLISKLYNNPLLPASNLFYYSNCT